MKARFIHEFLTAVGQARNSLHLISLPLFLMHGDGDMLVPISASEFIQRNISSESKTYEVCEICNICTLYMYYYAIAVNVHNVYHCSFFYQVHM